MNQIDDTQTEASNNLRSRAESILKEKSSALDNISNLSTDQLKSLFHDLHVHQIELELQNQELRETQQELSKSRDAFIDLYDFAPVGYLTISDTGIIVQANLTAAKMFASDRGTLLKKPLSTFVAPDDQSKYYLNVSQLKKDLIQTTWELRLSRSDASSFDGQLQFSPVLDIDGNFQHQFKVTISDITEIADIRRRLLQSEATFRSIFDNCVDGIILGSPDGAVIRANPSACAALGRSEEELKTVGRSGIIDSNDPRLQAHLERLLSAGKSSVEANYVTRDGTVFPVEVTTALFAEHDGSQRLVVSFRDISYRKKIEQELRDSESRLRGYFEAPLIGICVTSPEKGWIEVNEMTCHMLGYSREELLGMTWPQVVHPEDLASNLETFARLLAGEIDTFRTEIRSIRKDGQIIWQDMALGCARNQDGSVKYVIAFLMDISDRIEAEKRIQDSEKRFRDLAELLPQGIFEADSSGNLTYVNTAFKTIHGYGPYDEVIGMNAIDMVDPDQTHLALENIQLLRDGKHIVVEHRGRERSGIIPEVLLNIAPIFLDNQVVGSRGLLTDITQLKESERERASLQEQLFQSQKLASLGTLMGGIAHDFNNMLQIIIGYSELLLSDINEGINEPKLLTYIVKTAETAAGLVKKFMDLGQVSMLTPKLIDLNERIRDMEPLILRLPHIDPLTMDLVNEPTITEQDPDQLGQIIMILASNASEAMPNGGHLSFSTTRVILDEDYCKFNYPAKPGPHVLLTVTDNGRGIDEAILPQIFDPFFSTKERCDTKGMGLGLSVLRGIVQQRGGFVTCESQVGKGTTFRLYFPEIETSATTRVATPSNSLSGKTILIVEDNALVSGLEETAFNQAGYKTIVALNGEEAVDIYRGKHDEIGLVILDLLMPEMNGRECLMELRKINPMVKVVVLTGHDPKSEISLAVKPYVVGFIPKPCKMTQLVEAADYIIKH